MKNINKKYTTFRTARASASIKISSGTLRKIRSNDLPKPDPVAVARVAGIQAAKNTSSIIPYCHNIAIDLAGIEFDLKETRIEITATVKATAKTGVEMEALTAASAAALTLYDMLKGVDDSMEISNIQLLEKTGGKKSFTSHLEKTLSAAVLVISDRGSRKQSQDLTGPLIKERLQAEGFEVVDLSIIADDKATIKEVLRKYAEELHINLVLTTGGTGMGPRDSTPEATEEVIEKPLPGIVEAIRAYGQMRTPYAMLSQAAAGLLGETVIINLPGSKRGVEESLEVIFPAILHGFGMLAGDDH